jgi:hypothetical protein
VNMDWVESNSMQCNTKTGTAEPTSVLAHVSRQPLHRYSNTGHSFNDLGPLLRTLLGGFMAACAFPHAFAVTQAWDLFPKQALQTSPTPPFFFKCPCVWPASRTITRWASGPATSTHRLDMQLSRTRWHRPQWSIEDAPSDAVAHGAAELSKSAMQ